MRIKKMLMLLKEATEEKSYMYTKDELNYMNEQLKSIEKEIQKIEHKDYKGFGKK